MLTATNTHSAVCLTLTNAISKARTVDAIYTAALDALTSGLGVERSSILLFDPDGTMRFKAYRGLSATYRQAVEGHSPWTPSSVDPAPIVVPDVTTDEGLAPYLGIIEREKIAAMTFIPLVSLEHVIGKFMLYYPAPYAPSGDELQLAGVIAAQIAFAVERTRAEELSRRSEARLRFALDAASMGTWDWDLTTNTVRWSENLERIHGLPAGTFDGTFASYEREIHPDDRERVLASAQRALRDGVPHDVEYRVVAPDGTVRWCEGKGRVEHRDGAPVRMTGVCMMVTRRKEAELARLAAAEEASRLKDDFLATLSHELRTPLNAILGWVQIWQSGALSDERKAMAIDVISRNAKLQTRLIEDILDVSRIISGKLEVERVPVALSQVIETAVNAAAPSAAAKQIEVRTSLAADLPLIEGDPKRLHQVLNNVLANAVKFSPEGSVITVGCGVDNGWIHLEVCDAGIGIAPEFKPFVFDRFRQADSRSTRKHGGLGLGLAIARHLVEQHGGTIQAQSAGTDQGTTVVIRLPASRHSEALSPTSPEPHCLDDVQLDGLLVLVVEDQEDSRELLASLLESCGARVARCDSVISAIEVIASQAVRLIVADIAMPDIDGYELIRRLREMGKQTPAIAVTAFARPADRQRAVAAGYAAYCPKPVDTDYFLRTVATLVQRH
jgi:PAS domain S-box-containing protein